MKLCKDCYWHVRTMPDTVLAECTNDGNYVPDYVNGGTRFNHQTCAGVRHDPNMCGPDAKWFEPVQKAAAGQVASTASQSIDPEMGEPDPAPAAAPDEPYVDEELKARYERSHPKRYSQYENTDQMLDDPRRGQGDKER